MSATRRVTTSSTTPVTQPAGSAPGATNSAGTASTSTNTLPPGDADRPRSSSPTAPADANRSDPGVGAVVLAVAVVLALERGQLLLRLHGLAAGDHAGVLGERDLLQEQ